MTSLHTVSYGAGHDDTAPLVVLVHGALDRSTSFHRTATLLDGYRVVAYDRRGYGRSRHVAADSGAPAFADHVDDLFELVDGRACAVVGHSYGGDVAIAAACRRPDLVRSIGVFEAPMPWLPTWPADTAGAAAVRSSFGDDPGKAAEAFLIRMIGEERWQSLPERAKADRRAEGPALLSDLHGIHEREPFDVTAIPVPVVVGMGELGREHQRENCRHLAEVIPDVELVEIAGAAHGAHRSHPEEFAGFVRRVVDRMPAA